jgi:hypothetical protein
MATQSEQQSESSGPRRITTQVTSLDSLIGAHPDALKEIYRSGKPTDPAELGDAPRERVLAFEQAAQVFMATRPLLQALASDWMPRMCKDFDHGGNSGTNVLLGKKVFRFRAEFAASELDGAPALALRYADKALRNPWPIRAVTDELRTVGSGFAIGPAFFEWQGRQLLWLWFGLERVQGG